MAIDRTSSSRPRQMDAADAFQAAETTRGERRTLLIVSGGSEALAGIATARQMGLHVVVSDGDPAAPGLAAAHESLHASTYDIAATVAAARRYHREQRPIDGVISIASDVPLTVAAVAHELGLPGPTLETARLSADKLAMKQRLAEHGVAIPAFAATPTVGDLQAHVAHHGYPVVVKPVDSRGARGVLLLSNEGEPDVLPAADRTGSPPAPGERSHDLAWAHATALRESPSGRVMVERFLSGPQLSTESLVLDGVCHTIGLADRNYDRLPRFAPYVIEDGGQLPSALDAGEREAVSALVQAAAEALGMRSGVFKGDIVIHDGRPHVIEVAVRLSGGYLCTHEIPLCTGVDFVAQAIRVALGEAPSPEDLRPTRRRGVAQRWLFPDPGRVTRVAGVREVAARTEVALCEVRVGVGDEVPPLSSHRARAGVVIATGATRAQAIGNAQRAVAGIEIDTEPPASQPPAARSVRSAEPLRPSPAGRIPETKSDR